MLYKKALVVLGIALAVSWLQQSWLLVIPLSLLVYVLMGGWRFLRICYLTLGRDLRFIWRLIRVLPAALKFSRRDFSFPLAYEENAKKYPNKTALVFEGRTWTYQQLINYSNKIANHFRSAGYKKGDVVALFSENSPEFVGVWLGLGKLGAITALINSNLRAQLLMKCVQIASAKSLVFSADLSDAVQELDETFLKHLDLYSLGDSGVAASQNLELLLENQPSEYYTSSQDGSSTDVLLYIYTSGTTGLPKGAPMANDRVFYAAACMYSLLGFSFDDVLYISLPMYHSAATILGIASALYSGCSCVVRRKFSASHFWKDCVENHVTITQHVGEICRYLLTQPQSSWESQHKVRMIYGNGLRAQVWRDFKERYRVPKIVEFYAATEGGFAVFNVDGPVGSCGFLSRVIPDIKALFQVDMITGELKRGPDGLGIRCEPGQPGMAVAALVGPLKKAYSGYVGNTTQTKKKLAHNVFKHGDVALLSGDLLVSDELGNLYFKDRLGDTFRWKGENVSTAEVESSIMTLIDHSDAVVYGVEVPGAEGRAGMAAICDPERRVDLKVLAAGLKRSLPSYARPLFLRICDKVDLTGTFKLAKTRLKQEAFDLEVNGNETQFKLFYFEQKSGEYLPLDQAVYDQIKQGALRL